MYMNFPSMVLVFVGDGFSKDLTIVCFGLFLVCFWFIFGLFWFCFVMLSSALFSIVWPILPTTK